MNREEAKNTRKRNARLTTMFIFICCLLTFLLGFFAHWCVCQTSHEDTHKVELCGSATIYVKQAVGEDRQEVESPEVESPVTEESTEEVVVDPTDKFVSYYTYTEDDLDLLARLIFSEGGTESYETKLKIGSVVMNRVDGDTFPDSIREVIYQDRQFSVTTTRIGGVIMIDRPADEESKRAAREVLDYGSVLPSDVQVFYAKGCTEKWVTSRKKFGTFDKTVFAYLYQEDGVA